MHLPSARDSRVPIVRTTTTRRALVALAGLSLVPWAPATVRAGAQGATPDASPVATPVAGSENFIARFVAAAGEFSEGVTVAPDGTVYASLSLLGQLVRIGGDGASEVVGTVEGLQEGDLGLLGITAHADGSVYGGVFSANPDANGVWRFDVEGGTAERVPGTDQIGLANDVAFAPDGTMYATDTIAGAVWVAPPDGAAEQWLQHELLVGNERLGFPFPVGANGIVLDEGATTVYVAVLEQGTIVAIPIGEGGAAGEPAVHVELGTEDAPALPDGIAFDSAGNLYIAFPTLNMVSRLTTNNMIVTVATQADGLDGPASVAVSQDAGGAERLYVSNFSVALAPHVPPGGAGPGVLMFELSG